MWNVYNLKFSSSHITKEIGKINFDGMFDLTQYIYSSYHFNIKMINDSFYISLILSKI